MDGAENGEAEAEIVPPPRPVLDAERPEKSIAFDNARPPLHRELLADVFRQFTRHTPGAAQIALARVSFGLDAVYAVFSEADDHAQMIGPGLHVAESQRLVDFLDDPQIAEGNRIALLRQQTLELQRGDPVARCFYRDLLHEILVLGRVAHEREIDLPKLADALDGLESIGPNLVELYRRHQIIRGLLAPRGVRLHLGRLLRHVVEVAFIHAGMEHVKHFLGS